MWDRCDEPSAKDATKILCGFPGGRGRIYLYVCTTCVLSELEF